jgi:hypothetical protein
VTPLGALEKGGNGDGDRGRHQEDAPESSKFGIHKETTIIHIIPYIYIY